MSAVMDRFPGAEWHQIATAVNAIIGFDDEWEQVDDADLQQRIRERAFKIWVDEGQPEGRDKDHWELAKLAEQPGTSLTNLATYYRQVVPRMAKPR